MDKGISRRSFNLLTAGMVLGGMRWQAAPAFPGVAVADASGQGIFPFGTHVYREPHLPLEQLRHDLPILKRLGFTMIKIQEVWALDEQHEGEIDLSNVSRVVSDARQNGLRVYFGVTMENAPAWLWKKYPDASMVYETGERHNDPTQHVLPADGKPGPCWHHPGAREAGIRFIEAIGRDIGKYDNIQVWNVWQEIGFWPMRPGHLGFCYCHNTIPEFRRWLRRRYKSVGDLNATWKSGYGGWEEIEPPRFSPPVAPMIDWRYFMDDGYLSDVLQWKGDAFRRTDPLHRPILAHVSGSDVGGTREWRYAEVLDVLGSSCYPCFSGFDKWDADAPPAGKPMRWHVATHHELWENVMMKFDYVRSAKTNGEIWTAELQSGPTVEGLNMHGREPGPADIRRWVLGCLASGARGICFWNHRPEILWQEGYGFGLLDWGSDATPRAEEAGKLSLALNRHAELFTRGEHPEPQVAMLMNEDLYHFAEADPSSVRQHYAYTIRGIYRSLWEEGFPVRFVEAFAIPQGPEQAKILILPFPVALGSAVIAALEAYVRNGGTIVSEACPGRFSNYGMAFIGPMAPGVSDLFGVRHKHVQMVREPQDGAKWAGTELAWGDTMEYRDLVGGGDFAAFKVTPAYYLQTLIPSTALPILTYGEDVAGSVNTHGKGRAYLIGTLLGHGELAYGNSHNRRFLAAVLSRAGVQADKVGRLNRRRRALGNQAAWFLINTTSQPIEETVPLSGFNSVHDLLGEELPKAGDGVRLRVEPSGIRCLILEG